MNAIRALITWLLSAIWFIHRRYAAKLAVAEVVTGFREGLFTEFTSLVAQSPCRE